MSRLSKDVVCVARDGNGARFVYTDDIEWSSAYNRWLEIDDDNDDESRSAHASLFEGLPNDSGLAPEDSKFYYIYEGDSWSRRKPIDVDSIISGKLIVVWDDNIYKARITRFAALKLCNNTLLVFNTSGFTYIHFRLLTQKEFDEGAIDYTNEESLI